MSHCNRVNIIIFEFANLCAKRGSSLPLGTPMEIDFTNIFTLPTSPVLQICHSDNFLDQLRAFPPSLRTTNYSGLLFGKFLGYFLDESVWQVKKNQIKII